MRILLAGGGTAGHINPALAIAAHIRKQNPGAEILFAGTPGGMEARLVPKAGFGFTPIKVQGFYRGFTPKDIAHNLGTLKYLATAGFTARKIIRAFAPDVAVGTGGYVSGPIVETAQKCGIKTLIHEQNAFPGVTTKLLAKHADKIMLAVEEAKQYLPAGKDYQVVGNPVRESVILCSKREARRKLGIGDGVCILSFGGSLGAHMINLVAADLIGWHAKEGKIHHIHAYGQYGGEEFPAMLRERGVDPKMHPQLDIREYIDNMDLCMAAADLVVCRAGAITLSELEATGKASILIPSPNVTANHQYHNAMVLQNHGAGIVVEEKQYHKQKLLTEVEALCREPDRLKRLGMNASKLAVLDTCERIYAAILELISPAG